MVTPEERRGGIRALVAAEPDPDGGAPDGTVRWLQRLCRATARALPAAGTTISLMTGDGVHGVAAASEPAWETLDHLQFTLGEGPSLEAFQTRRPVLETGPGSGVRWPSYWAAVQEQDACSVFAFPLQTGAARLGTLTAYRTVPGGLSTAALAQAVTFAEVAVETLLDGQEDASPHGPDATADTLLEATLEATLDSQFTVYQAQGMAMVDLDVSLADAMARLQAHAYTQGRPLQEIARDIVAGRLRLERDGP